VVLRVDRPFEGVAYPDRRTPIPAPQGGLGVVADGRSDTLSLMDLGAGERLAAVPVGRDPVSIDGPTALALDAPRGAIYMTISNPEIPGAGPHAAHASGKSYGHVQALSRVDLRLLGEVQVDGKPASMILSEDRARLVVSHFNLKSAIAQLPDIESVRGVITIIDPGGFEVDPPPGPKSIAVCVAPDGLALSRPDGAKAFVACYGEDTIAVVDVSDPSADPVRIALGPTAGTPDAPIYGPSGVSLSPDGATVAIGCQASKEVRFFDVPSSLVLDGETIAVPGSPRGLAWSLDGSRLYVPTQDPDAIHAFDADGGEVAHRAFTPDECSAPRLVHPAGAGRLLLVCSGDAASPGRLLSLDEGTLDTVWSAQTGVYPDALAVVPGGAP
jgi:DNA-binding beta-propeller fold protein YncE